MMKKRTLLILQSHKIAKDTFEMILENKELSQMIEPGQFLHIRVPHFTLRRPISVADIDVKLGTVTIVFKVIGEGTQALAKIKTGEQIDVLGPLGQGFDLNQKENSTVLLIGGGIGVPPLHYLGRLLAEKNIKVKTILGYQTVEAVFYEDEFKQFSDTYIATDDGTYGHKGFVTDAIEQIGHFDLYYTCGPTQMLQAVTEKLVDKKGYVSLEERMGCGVGACFACVIKTDDEGGYKKICQDGPVFSTEEVIL